jgi:acyl carrier protein
MSEITISDELRTGVREIVAAVLEVDEAELTDGSHFVDDFDADSLLIIEMYARFERNLGVRIPQEDVVELDDLPTAYEVVARHATGQTHD